jgi:hypothetical protein
MRESLLNSHYLKEVTVEIKTEVVSVSIKVTAEVVVVAGFRKNFIQRNYEITVRRLTCMVV